MLKQLNLARCTCRLLHPFVPSRSLSSQPPSHTAADDRPHPVYSQAEDAFDAPAHASPTYRPKRTGPRQRLNEVEKRTFETLLRGITPAVRTSKHVAVLLPAEEVVDKVQQALERSAAAKRGGKPGRVLKRVDGKTAAEEARLDSLREKMVRFQTDHELLEWSWSTVFGLLPPAAPGAKVPATTSTSTTAASTTGPTASIFPDLVLILFLLLRDTHHSPHAALHVFALAARTPESYVHACTSKLYHELLRTRWMLGDIESVATGLSEMQESGVRITPATTALVEEIGGAVRRDEALAERRAAVALSLSPPPPPRSDDSTIELPSSVPTFNQLVERHRLFSPSQLRAWGRMEQIIEETQADREKREVARQDARYDAMERRRYHEEDDERREAEQRSPSLHSRRRAERSPFRSRRGEDDDDAALEARDRTWRDFPL